MSLLPVSCYTCGKVLGRYNIKLDNHLRDGGDIKEFMEKNGITRYCCKLRIMGYVPEFDYDRCVEKIHSLSLRSQNQLEDEKKSDT